MLRTAFALALAATALPTFAEDARISRPIEAGSIVADGVWLVAYYVPLDDDAYEVSAPYIGPDDAEPSRLVMRLEEGDDVSFSLPGHLESLLTFSREFDSVRITAEPAAATLRSASL